MTKYTFLPSYIEIGPVVSAKKIFKVFCIDTYIGKISPAPWGPCFLTNPNGLNNLGRESPKEHFCKIIWKLVKDDFYIFLYIGKISPGPWRPCFFDKSK